MKRKLPLCVYGIVFVIGTGLALIFGGAKDALFWLSYIFFVLGLLASCFTLMKFVDTDHKDFIAEFSLVLITHLYWLCTIVGTIAMRLLHCPILYAFGVHLLLIGVFATLYILLTMGKRHIADVGDDLQRKRKE